MNSYLELAEQILSQSEQPLSPAEILQRGYLDGVVPWHLFGRTQHKTLHARLSEDIAKSPDESRFYRTSPGVFFLRNKLDDPNIQIAHKKIHRAPPRRKELKRDYVLAMRSAEVRSVAAAKGKIAIGDLERILEAGHYKYAPWSDVSLGDMYLPVYSFVIVRKGNHLLSYRSGRYRANIDPIYGKRSLGLGGVVFAGDLDLLHNSFFGIVSNGIKELVYGIGLPRRLAAQARYNNEVVPNFAIVVDDHGRAPFLHAVMGYQCPDEFAPNLTALSLNDAGWVPIDQRLNDLSEYDTTSQRILEFGWATEVV